MLSAAGAAAVAAGVAVTAGAGVVAAVVVSGWLAGAACATGAGAVAVATGSGLVSANGVVVAVLGADGLPIELTGLLKVSAGLVAPIELTGLLNKSVAAIEQCLNIPVTETKSPEGLTGAGHFSEADDLRIFGPFDVPDVSPSIRSVSLNVITQHLITKSPSTTNYLTPDKR